MSRIRGALAALSTALLGLSLVLAAPADADEQVGVPLRLGVMVPYGVQPGGRLTAGFELPLIARDPDAQWRTALFVGPELGVYTRPENYTSALAGAVFGYRMESPTGCCLHELAVSLAYVGEWHITSVDVDLATGELTEHRALLSHALPAGHYTFAWQFFDRWGWYLDLGVGLLASLDLPSALYFAGESGLQVRFDLLGGSSK